MALRDPAASRLVREEAAAEAKAEATEEANARTAARAKAEAEARAGLRLTLLPHCGNILLPFMKSITYICMGGGRGSERRHAQRWSRPAPQTGQWWCGPRLRGLAAAADLVLADELLDPRVEGLGAHLHGRRAVRRGRARRQLQRRRRLE